MLGQWVPGQAPVQEVSVVIVNFRTPKLAADAARSALDQPETLEVLVVDNASGDDSVELLKGELSDPRVRIIASDKNLGFGGGNNLGASEAKGEFLFLLNSDATLHAGALQHLIGALKRDTAIGVAAPFVYLPDGVIQPDSWGDFPTVRRTLLRQLGSAPNTLEPDWVTGAAMLVRRKEFLEIGGFDEDIFMYLEDVLLCWQFKRRGKRAVRLPEAGVKHLRGASNQSDWRQKGHYYAAQDVLFRKMGESGTAIAVLRLFRLPYRAWRRLKLLLGR